MENQIFNQYAAGRRRDWCGGDYFNSCGADRSCHHFQIPAYQSGADNFRKDYQRKRGNLERSDARKLKGEITVFLSLIFILLVSFAGAVMESASIQMAKNYGRI